MNYLRAAAISGLVFALIISVWNYENHVVTPPGDSVSLIKDTARLLKYLDGQLSERPGGQFPLLQSIPVSAMTRLKMGLADQLDILMALNSVSLLVSLTWGAYALRTRGRFAPLLFIPALLLSPLPWYSQSCFGEMLAAFCTLGLVISCCLDLNPAMIISFMMLSGVSKETAVPFLLPLGACASASRSTRKSQADSCSTTLAQTRLWPLFCGALLAITLNAALNWVRFGSVWNQWYLRRELIVHDWRTWADFFAAIWVAPNGGLAVFWPTSVLLLLVAGAGVLRRFRDCQSDSPAAKWFIALQLFCVVGVLAGVTAGLACWHAPLGWNAWGPRLILPWVPASLFLVLFVYGGVFDRAMGFLERRPVLWILVLGTVAGLSMPQVFVMFKPQSYHAWFFERKPTPAFPKLRDVGLDPEYFYRSEKYDMWQREWILKSAYIDRPVSIAQGIALADSLALAVLLPLLASGTAHDERAGRRGASRM